MAADPIEILKVFAGFLGVASDMVVPVVNGFAAQHPELFDETSPQAPPPAPNDDLDPDVRAAIEKGEL